MAVCEYCNQEMLDHKSCLPKINIDGEVYDRIPYGEETRYGDIKFSEFCHDCACCLGDFHHFHCDMEENPVTHEQLLLDILDDPTIFVTE